MSRSPRTHEDDLLRFLLGDDGPVRSTSASASASSSSPAKGDEAGWWQEEEEEEAAVEPLLHSPLTEDAALVVAMFEREAELCPRGASSSDAAACAVGAFAAPVQALPPAGEEMAGNGKEQAAIKEGDELICRSEDVEIKRSDARREEEGYTARRTRSLEVHNRCERKRRGRINQRFKALQKLVPRCNDKSDKASILDETIVYVKTLQQQIQMISSGCGITQMVFPAVQACMIPSAAMCLSNVGQPVPATADQVMAGGGGCPVYPGLPYGLFGRGPAVAADSVGHRPASWPLFPPAFQPMSMASFGQAMGAPTNQQYNVPNAFNVGSYQDMQVGNFPS